MSGTLTESGPVGRRAGRFARLVVCLFADRPRTSPLRVSLEGVDELRLTRGDGLRRFQQDGSAVVELALADPHLSSDHARLTRLGGRWLLEDRGSKNGTRVGGRAESRVFLSDGDVIEAGHCFFVFRLDGERTATEPTPAADAALRTLVPSLEHAFEELARVARADVPIVLRGDSGTGKELVARAVHSLSGRSGRFVAVNCGALPESLVTSELFGYRKGAFSGASEDRAGLVRSADHGTLLLDEIADLPAVSQAALLRVLQEREVTPLGSTAPIPVELRVVSATHRDVEELVAQGKFREDLWARLAGHVVSLPSLRDRREDLGLLVGALLARLRPDPPAGVAVSLDTARALLRYEWPRNIRELELALGSALALAGSGPIEVEHLPAAVRNAATVTSPASDRALEADAPGAELREELTRLLRKHGGNLSAVARELRKDRKQIQRWIQRLGIDPDRYRV